MAENSMLKGRVAIVTGSSRGIGAATARLLAAHGAKVAVNYHRNRAAGEKVVEEITSAGGAALLVQADVTVAEDAFSMAGCVEEELGPVDILVNNANISFPVKAFFDYRWEDFEIKLVHEMKAAFNCCQAVLRGMASRKRGCIVNVSSGLSRMPGLGFVAHSTAKSGLDGFSKALAQELGPHGIRVNVVAPGLTLTDATADQPREMHEAIARHTPLRRLAEPHDVAGAILFFCADWAGFVTGAYLPVSGGTQMM